MAAHFIKDTEALEINMNTAEYFLSLVKSSTEGETDFVETEEINREGNEEKPYASKKRNKSEKQKERTRQYKKKIKNEKRRVAAEMRNMSRNKNVVNEDGFGSLSIFVESGLHSEFKKVSTVIEQEEEDFGYKYFSLSDFWT